MNGDDRLRAERDLYRKLLDLGERTDVEQLLREALALLVESTGAQKGYIEISDAAAGGAVRFWTAHALTGDAVEEVRTSMSRGILAQALASGRTVQTASAHDDPRFRERESVQDFRIEAVLCVPIGGPPALGVACLQGRSDQLPFGREDIARAEIVARGVAPSAERLLLRLRTGDESDATTGVRAVFPAESLVGKSRALAATLRDAAMVAPRDVNVLLTGASGSGKTELARLLWRHGARCAGPFVELNCAAMPATLVEQELFGAAPGAHSTAARPIDGKVAAADGGVLFLDEVGELPIDAQAKLLRFVEDKAFYRLGSTTPERADVRIVSATNSDLEEAVRARRFRADLYWRLATFPIRVPSLSERVEDVPIVARHLVERFAAVHGRPDLALSEPARLAVWTTPWPGNVRELAGRLEAAVLRAIHDDAPQIGTRHVFPDRDGVADGGDAAPTWHEAQRVFQRRLLADALAATKWNVAETARRLDLGRSHLYALIEAHGLRREG